MRPAYNGLELFFEQNKKNSENFALFKAKNSYKFSKKLSFSKNYWWAKIL